MASTPLAGPVGGPEHAERRSRVSAAMHQLYVWVLLGIVLGIVVGGVAPGVGESLQPLGTTFVNAIKMVITPIIFVTVVAGIAASATSGRSAGSASRRSSTSRP